MTPVSIADEIAEGALDTLRELSGTEAPDAKTDLRRERAATNLLKFYQTQERYNLNPQTPQDYARALNHPRATSAKTLETLSPEALAELQREMIGDRWRKHREELRATETNTRDTQGR